MGIPRSLGWLVVTGVIVAGLVGLSYLALDKQNVVWSEQKPYCPHCRVDVPFYAHRCRTCGEEFDWVVSPDEDSPWCGTCVGKAEMDAMISRSKALGEPATVTRLSKALGLPEDAARAWWKAFEPGRCGWCGGTGRDLGGAAADECPVCFGEQTCIGCDGDLRTHLGNERAARERERMDRDLLQGRSASEEVRAREHRERAKEFLSRFPGTLEATQVTIDERALRRPPPEPLPPGAVRKRGPDTAAGAARERVAKAIRALSE